MDLHCDLHEEYHESIFFGSDVPETVSGFLARYAVSPRGKIKVEEYCIKPENFLFVLGTLSQNPGLDVSLTPAWAARAGGTTGPRPPKIPPQSVTNIEPLQQVIRISAGLPPVPVSQMTQQQKIAAALAKAGVMQAMPWTGGPKIQAQLENRAKENGETKTQPQSGNGAKGSVESKVKAHPVQPQQGNGAKAQPVSTVKASASDAAELLSGFAQAAGVGNVLGPKPAPSPAARVPFDPAGFDLHPPVVLMKGSNEPTFFISWRSQRDVVNTLNWKSTLLIWGCPALVLTCAWVLVTYYR
jgi:hypothetical protein